MIYCRTLSFSRIVGRITRRVAVAVCAGAGLLLTTMAGTATAHSLYIYHGADYVGINPSHNLIRVGDRECDGNNVYAEAYYVRYNQNRYAKLWATGCGSSPAVVLTGPAYKFRVCENGVGCSGWSYT